MADPRDPRRVPLWLLVGLALLFGAFLSFLVSILRNPGLAFAVSIFYAGAIMLALRQRMEAQFGRIVALVKMLPTTRQPEPFFGELEGVITALQHSSERLEATLQAAGNDRAQLESVLDSMQDAVVAVDAGGRIQWTNAPLERLVPGTPGQSVRTGQALVQTVRDPEILGCVSVALEEKQVSVRRTTSLVPGRIFEVDASPMPGGGAVAVLRDVTRMEELERTQRDFVANVSHELRTPLTSITGYVETLLDMPQANGAPLSGHAREFLETILKNATRMTRLTEDLLVMARVEAPKVELRPSSVPAALLVREAVKAVRGIAQEDEAELILEDLTEAEVFADPDSVLQVLGNFVENAIKYGRPRTGGGARVVLRARSLADSVEFSVEDFGSGIASEHLPRIFERFYRVDKARSRDSGGTGLGLSIARHIVQTQGGRIWAESSLGAGSTFLFTLPRTGFPRTEPD